MTLICKVQVNTLPAQFILNTIVYRRIFDCQEAMGLRACASVDRTVYTSPHPITMKKRSAMTNLVDQAVWAFTISSNFSAAMACSRSLNFCTLPLAVIGKASTNWK